MNIQKELQDMQDAVLSVTSLYGTPNNLQKKELHDSFNKLKEAISATQCCCKLKGKKELTFDEWQNLNYEHLIDNTYINRKEDRFYSMQDIIIQYNTYKKHSL